ncbi:hypothetical protein BX616_003124 [Lobosporangium transversale]|uniref:Uncharacterized protein n=1 Tax=Lobosporangium transversale TaxID=64571 RepID=A0A1Y2GCY4_9FUNG|nr:hypothetical protein BCR41DRAFT_360305 [Lobosporangium transversale]KAF9899287.1 hypothetical protein BX616_003124 [Lobosporangium transversale]ORZ07275.1 hypothetical protein BCR41DRAFT_360305 [Lobosporangium transversale]|eukprot:XP_021877938.1 hypothetical protein BCR41DRAFT_360305 [Lobosporangium transversale]
MATVEVNIAKPSSVPVALPPSSSPDSPSDTVSLPPSRTKSTSVPTSSRSAVPSLPSPNTVATSASITGTTTDTATKTFITSMSSNPPAASSPLLPTVETTKPSEPIPSTTLTSDVVEPTSSSITATATTTTIMEPTEITTDPVITTDPAPSTSTDVATTDPVPPTTTATDEEPSTTTVDPTTTTDPPMPSPTITRDPPVTTDPPITQPTLQPTIPPITRPPSSVHSSKTTTPYTTRYITTVSVVTITTVVPKTTVISGRGTTIYITETTTTSVPTTIPDPNQEPPPGTLLDPNNGRGTGLKTWQITLIIVACLVVGIAVGAVVLVGWIKKRRRRKEMMQRNNIFDPDGLSGSGGRGGGSAGGGESVLESEYTDNGGKSNRALVTSAVPGGFAQTKGTGTGRNGGWRGRWNDMFKFRRSWGSQGFSQRQPGGLDQELGVGASGGVGPSGLWLMEDNYHDLGYEGPAAVAAAMNPVSYQNDHSAAGAGAVHHLNEASYSSDGSGAYFATAGAASGQGPDMAEVRHAHYLRQQDRLGNPDVTDRSPGVMYSALLPVSSPARISPLLVQQGHIHSPDSGSRVGGTPSPSSPDSNTLQQEHLSQNSDYVDGYGFGQRQSQQPSIDHELLSVGSSCRVSHDGSMAIRGHTRGDSGTESGRSDTVGDGNRTTIYVDPEQLESNAISEYVRKGPQALPKSASQEALDTSADTNEAEFLKDDSDIKDTGAATSAMDATNEIALKKRKNQTPVQYQDPRAVE